MTPMSMEVLFGLENATLNEELSFQDYFKGVFANPLINWAAIFLYFLGFFGVWGVAMVIWFERSGRAGNYR